MFSADSVFATLTLAYGFAHPALGSDSKTRGRPAASPSDQRTQSGIP